VKRYGELYSSYEEFMEEEAMLLKRLETHGKEWIAAREEAARAQQEVERVKLSVHKLKKRVSELEKQLEEARKP
jgi:predicted  nucleic acid-binding Zn-ribbon protein